MMKLGVSTMFYIKAIFFILLEIAINQAVNTHTHSMFSNFQHDRHGGG